MPSDPTQPASDAPFASAPYPAPPAETTPETPPNTTPTPTPELAPATAPDTPAPPRAPTAPAKPGARHDPHAAIRARIRQLQRAQAARERQQAENLPCAPQAAAKPAPKRRRPEGMVWRDLSATGWTSDKQRAFLEHLATHGCVSHAAASVGLSKQSAYALRHRGGRTVFALAWDVAIRSARKALLDEALERAFAGRAAPVWYRGEQVGERIVHNDRLLMQLLAHKLEPINSAHDEATLAQAWPALLAQVDFEQPFDARTLRDPDHDEIGNDRT